jgi:acetyl-CoA carboxylase carboxyl transferase subunit alpha
MAQKFGIPVITFINTSGANPGFEAESRGQSESIAKSIEISSTLTIPNISVIIGEGMSGGAIAIGLSNYVYILEHSIYAVISPEACSSILWHTSGYKHEAAASQKLTSHDLKLLNIVDGVIPEPLGGAHRDNFTAIENVGKVLFHILNQVISVSGVKFLEHRQKRFLSLGKSLHYYREFL